MEPNTTFSIGELINFQKFEDVPHLEKPLTKKEKREILMREIYDFYKGDYDKRRKENWNRYCRWLKENKINEKILGRDKNLRKFKRTKMYIREIGFESLCFLLKHIPLDDLHYFTSTGKEFSHTGRNFSGWLSQWFEKIVKI